LEIARVDRNATVEEVLELVRQLSTVEKVRLIERVAPEIERELVAGRLAPRVSLLGLVKDLGPAPSAEEIDACRREAWATFPRDET
jgi:hypothetical protein